MAGCRDCGRPGRDPGEERSPCSCWWSRSAGWACARFALLLADVRPYTGWYWFVAVAAGIVIAVAPVWVLSRATVWARAARAARGGRGTARWPGWLLAGYVLVLIGGIKYYLSLRYTPPPSGVTVAPPSALFVFEMAGLAAETLIMVAITLLLLAVTTEIIAPGPLGPWRAAHARERNDARAQA